MQMKKRPDGAFFHGEAGLSKDAVCLDLAAFI